MILWVYPRPTNSGVREGFEKGGPAHKIEQMMISLLVLVGGYPQMILLMIQKSGKLTS